MEWKSYPINLGLAQPFAKAFAVSCLHALPMRLFPVFLGLPPAVGGNAAQQLHHRAADLRLRLHFQATAPGGPSLVAAQFVLLGVGR